MNLKNALAAGAGVLVIAAAALGPSLAFAYATLADCEAGEGVGRCGYCPQGAGDPGYHHCPSAILKAPLSASLLMKLTTDENNKLTAAKVSKIPKTPK